MSKMIYQWREGSTFPIGARIAAERLRIVRMKAGALTPRAVVDDAAEPGSPLHDCFEWNNAKAADAHRLSTARTLIGSLIVVEVDGADVSMQTRGFVHVASAHRYEPVEVALSRPDMRAETLARARAEMVAWRTRYAALREFAAVHVAIDKALAS